MNRTLKAIAALMLMMVFAVSCNKPDEPNNGGNNGDNDSIIDNTGTLNGHDYVDLSLPSGTLWATCNIGANKPEDYGIYFAWGETEAKEIYDWGFYRYCGSEYNQMTKYCSNPSYGYNGFTDNLTILQYSDDAAHANWGAGWCMPTKEQWEELYQNTSHIWMTQNGVNGRLFTGLNGKTLFLPASGCRDGHSLYGIGNVGNYWSKSLDIDHPSGAWYFDYYSGDYGVKSYHRSFGRSVRPVCI